jgi:hypothetical protein
VPRVRFDDAVGYRVPRLSGCTTRTFTRRPCLADAAECDGEIAMNVATVNEQDDDETATLSPVPGVDTGCAKLLVTAPTFRAAMP